MEFPALLAQPPKSDSGHAEWRPKRWSLAAWHREFHRRKSPACVRAELTSCGRNEGRRKRVRASVRCGNCEIGIETSSVDYYAEPSSARVVAHRSRYFVKKLRAYMRACQMSRADPLKLARERKCNFTLQRCHVPNVISFLGAWGPFSRWTLSFREGPKLVSSVRVRSARKADGTITYISRRSTWNCVWILNSCRGALFFSFLLYARQSEVIPISYIFIMLF